MPLMPAPLIEVRDDAGAVMPFAKAYFTGTGGIIAVAVYQDAAFGSPHPDPVVANAAGVFPAIYSDPSLGKLRMRITAANGDLSDPDYDIDPVNSVFTDGDVTNAILAPMPASTFKANLTGGEAQPGDYGIDDVTNALRYATDAAQGVIIIATEAEVMTGAVTDKVVTPATLAAKLASGPTSELDAEEGYIIFPGGLTLQWGRVGPIAIDGYVDITFPIPFPADIYNVQHSPRITGPYTLRFDSWSLAADAPTLVGFRVYCASSANSTPVYVDWQAIGK